jgi:hypothetical protein
MSENGIDHFFTAALCISSAPLAKFIKSRKRNTKRQVLEATMISRLPKNKKIKFKNNAGIFCPPRLTLTEDDKPKEEKKVVVGKECGNPETLSKVEKNMQAIKSKAATWGFAVEDKGKGYCGYDMVSGKKSNTSMARSQKTS